MPARPTPKQATGNFGEEAAARHLAAKGFRLLARNWRKGSYELDLVCAERDTLVFVEVKTRGQGSLESPEEALPPAKQRSLLRAAQEYLQETGAWDAPCRFDLVSVALEGAGGAGHKAAAAGSVCQVEHIENVLEFDNLTAGTGRTGRAGNPVGGGNAPWQPW